MQPSLWFQSRISTVQVCDFGRLPGRWAKDGHGTYRWTLFDPDCQLTDYISAQVSHPRARRLGLRSLVNTPGIFIEPLITLQAMDRTGYGAVWAPQHD